MVVGVLWDSLKQVWMLLRSFEEFLAPPEALSAAEQVFLQLLLYFVANGEQVLTASIC